MKGGEMSLKKLLSVLLLLGMLCIPLSSGMAEITYSPADDVEYVELLTCPEVDWAQLMDDEIQISTAEALTRWFIGYNALRQNWYQQFWDHTAAILTDPYLIKVNEDQYGCRTVYCFAAINSFGLLQGDDGALYFAQSEDDIWLFRVSIENSGDDLWINDVYPITDMDEELYPGAGYGTQGFAGQTDELMIEIPDRYWSCIDIAQRYLELNGIDATIIVW